MTSYASLFPASSPLPPSLALALSTARTLHPAHTLIFDRLLLLAHIPLAYPPADPDARDQLLEAIEHAPAFDRLKKDCLVFYLLRDLDWAPAEAVRPELPEVPTGHAPAGPGSGSGLGLAEGQAMELDEDEVEDIVVLTRAESFAAARRIPVAYRISTSAFWMLDHGLQQRAIAYLTDPRFTLDPTFTSHILLALSPSQFPHPPASPLPRPSPSGASPSELLSSRLTLRFLRATRPSLTAWQDAQAELAARAVADVAQAWAYVQGWRAEGEGEGEELLAAEWGRGSDDEKGTMYARLAKRLIEWCFIPKPRPTPVRALLALPLPPIALPLLTSLSLRPPPSFPPTSLPILHTLLHTRLIQAGHYAEAASLDARFSAVLASRGVADRLSADSARVAGEAARARKAAVARAAKALPRPQREVIDLVHARVVLDFPQPTAVGKDTDLGITMDVDVDMDMDMSVDFSANGPRTRSGNAPRPPSPPRPAPLSSALAHYAAQKPSTAAAAALLAALVSASPGTPNNPSRPTKPGKPATPTGTGTGPGPAQAVGAGGKPPPPPASASGKQLSSAKKPPVPTKPRLPPIVPFSRRPMIRASPPPLLMPTIATLTTPVPAQAQALGQLPGNGNGLGPAHAQQTQQPQQAWAYPQPSAYLQARKPSPSPSLSPSPSPAPGAPAQAKPSPNTQALDVARLGAASALPGQLGAREMARRRREMERREGEERGAEGVWAGVFGRAAGGAESLDGSEGDAGLGSDDEPHLQMDAEWDLAADQPPTPTAAAAAAAVTRKRTRARVSAHPVPVAQQPAEGPIMEEDSDRLTSVGGSVDGDGAGDGRGEQEEGGVKKRRRMTAAAAAGGAGAAAGTGRRSRATTPTTTPRRKTRSMAAGAGAGAEADTDVPPVPRLPEGAGKDDDGPVREKYTEMMPGGFVLPPTPTASEPGSSAAGRRATKRPPSPGLGLGETAEEVQTPRATRRKTRAGATPGAAAAGSGSVGESEGEKTPSSAHARLRRSKRGASEDPELQALPAGEAGGSARSLRRSTRLSAGHLGAGDVPPVPALPTSASMGSLSSLASVGNRTPRAGKGRAAAAAAAGGSASRTPAKRRGFRAESVSTEEGDD